MSEMEYVPFGYLVLRKDLTPTTGPPIYRCSGYMNLPVARYQARPGDIILDVNTGRRWTYQVPEPKGTWTEVE